MRNLMSFFIIAVLGIWLFKTCSTSFSPESIKGKKMEINTIENVREHITDFQNRAVLINGQVESSYYFNFFGGGFYTINDGTAKIAVFTKKFTPKKGSFLKIVVEPKPFLRMGATTGVTATEITILRTTSKSSTATAAILTNVP